MPRTKIMVADDDRIILSALSKGLRDANYEVLSASDGDEAVRMGCREHPDLAVLDIRMPGVFGIEAARQLRRLAGIDSIFLSAYADREVVELAIKEGALGYLVEPINSNQLIPAIEAALERSAELRHLHENRDNLADAIKSNREISVAIGIYMERFNVGEREAFGALRGHARSERIKLVELARELNSGSIEKDSLLEEIHYNPYHPPV